MKRLRCLGHWNEYSNYLNWKNLNNEITDYPIFNMHTDDMITKFAFYKPFEVQFPTRDNWKVVPFQSGGNHLVWYTDGSKMDAGTGAGVCCLRDGTKFSYPLGKYMTVFQAEVFAILMCCSICIDRGYKNKCIYICSDSQAALLALQRKEITSSLVWECYSMLCILANGNKVHLYWVPGHTGIQGNELADELARNGSETPFIGPEPVLDISGNLIRGTVFRIFRQQQYKNWLNTKGQRQAKELNSGCPSIRSKELMKLNKNGIRRAVGLLTGHCCFKRHLHVMGVIDDPICRGCLYKEETVSHVLCECEEFSAYRFEHLGRHLIEPWELQNIPIRSMLNFVSAIGLFKD